MYSTPAHLHLNPAIVFSCYSLSCSCTCLSLHLCPRFWADVKSASPVCSLSIKALASDRYDKRQINVNALEWWNTIFKISRRLQLGFRKVWNSMNMSVVVVVVMSEMSICPYGTFGRVSDQLVFCLWDDKHDRMDGCINMKAEGCRDERAGKTEALKCCCITFVYFYSIWQTSLYSLIYTTEHRVKEVSQSPDGAQCWDLNWSTLTLIR